MSGFQILYYIETALYYKTYLFFRTRGLTTSS